jgi:hypothetical protein
VPSPVMNRYPNLQSILVTFSKAVADARARSALADVEPLLFSAIFNLWLKAPDPSNIPPLGKVGSDVGLGPEIISAVEEIFAKDKHLSECAGSAANLATFFDTFFIERMATAIRAGSAEPEKLFQEFAKYAYETGAFANLILSHLFNFQMEEAEWRCGNIRIVRYPQLTATMAPGHQVGDCVVVTEVAEPSPASDAGQWINQRNELAFSFARSLKYFKGGVVHIDYVYRQFRPDWSNQIRVSEHLILGAPRWVVYEGGSKPYTLSLEERSRLEQWWRVYTHPRCRKANERPKSDASTGYVKSWRLLRGESRAP